jgi:hypothetical protein
MKKNSRVALLFLVSAIFVGLIFASCASTESVSELPKPGEQPAYPAREPIVLVCQIDAMSSDQGIGVLSRSLAPLIRRDLFCVKQISVIPSGSIDIPLKPYFLTEPGLKKLGTVYGADMITVGLLSGTSESISLDFKIYDTRKNHTLLNTKVEGKPSKFFDLQRRLTYEFIDAVGVDLSKEERTRIEYCSPKKLKAAICYGDGLNCEQTKKNNEALMSYSDALHADKSIATPYMDEARVFRRFNAPTKSMQSLESAVIRDKYFAEAWHQLSIHVARYTKDNDLAKKYCEQALEIAPRFGNARLSLGTILYALGDLPGAIEEMKIAVELMKVSPLPRFDLGVFYAESGKPEEAKYWFEQALKVDPDFERASLELQKLENS